MPKCPPGSYRKSVQACGTLLAQLSASCSQLYKVTPGRLTAYLLDPILAFIESYRCRTVQNTQHGTYPTAHFYTMQHRNTSPNSSPLPQCTCLHITTTRLLPPPQPIVLTAFSPDHQPSTFQHSPLPSPQCSLQCTCSNTGAHPHSSSIYGLGQAHHRSTTHCLHLHPHTHVHTCKRVHAHTSTHTPAQLPWLHTAQFGSRTPTALSYSPFSPPVLLSHKLFVFIKQKSKVFLRCPEP